MLNASYAYASRNQRVTGCSEAHSCGTGEQNKNPPSRKEFNQQINLIPISCIRVTYKMMFFRVLLDDTKTLNVTKLWQTIVVRNCSTENNSKPLWVKQSTMVVNSYELCGVI
jgi:hypothetical protein